MTEEAEVKQIEEILGKLDLYIRNLSWFPGNATLKWLADSTSRTCDVASDKKQVVKNANEMIKYIDDLPWAKDNAGMWHAKSELKKCLEIYGVVVVKEDSGYDDPNPQPPVKSEVPE